MIHANKAEGEQITKGGRVGSAERSVCAFTLSLSASKGNLRSKRMIRQCTPDRMKTFQPAECSDVGQKQCMAVKMSFTSVYIFMPACCVSHLYIIAGCFELGKHCTSKISSCLNGCNFNSLNNVGISQKYIFQLCWKCCQIPSPHTNSWPCR